MQEGNLIAQPGNVNESSPTLVNLFANRGNLNASPGYMNEKTYTWTRVQVVSENVCH